MISFCFHGGDKEFINITRYGAIWTNIEKCRLSFKKSSLKLEIDYFAHHCYFTLYRMYELLSIDLNRYGVWPNRFYGNLSLYYYERRWLLPKRSKTSERFSYCQMLLGLKMTYTVLIIRNLKIIIMIFVLVSWNSRGKMEIVVILFGIKQKSIIKNLQGSCLIKNMTFPFISVACPIWISIYHLKYFML